MGHPPSSLPTLQNSTEYENKKYAIHIMMGSLKLGALQEFPRQVYCFEILRQEKIRCFYESFFRCGVLVGRINFWGGKNEWKIQSEAVQIKAISEQSANVLNFVLLPFLI